MASYDIETLLLPSNVDESNQKAIQLVNSHYRTFEDLRKLEAHLVNSRRHDEVLKKQVSQSQSSIDALLAETRTAAPTLLQTARELSIQRHSLNDDLSGLSEELVSSMSENGGGNPTLLEDIEKLHRNLKELENVKIYVQIIHRVLQLSDLAVEQLRSSPSSVSSSTVTSYKSLEAFVARVTQTCTTVEGKYTQQPLALVSFLEKVQKKTWLDMKNILFTPLLDSLEKLHWPMPVNYLEARIEDRKAFEDAFRNLLALQRIADEGRKVNAGKESLYVLQALVLPVSLRFKYHFDGTRQTNRLDKPEWYFTHVLNVIHDNRPFLDSVVQGLLSSTEYREVQAWREFAYLLLPLIHNKLRKTVPTLLNFPSLLAHTIYEALSFDTALREEGFGLSESSAENSNGQWDGVSEFILGNREWFNAWLQGEKKFADDQYNEIISSSDAWLIVEDEAFAESSHDGSLRTTNSARRVKNFLEQVTDRYSPLPKFAERTRFLISVQVPLLEHYHSRISSSLDAFETLSSVFVRAVPGALGVSLGGGSSTTDSGVKMDTRRLTSGTEGVQRLCKALISAKYISVAMDAWGEDLFFLELWTEINHRASLRIKAENHPSLPDPKIETEATDGTIFEELIQQYNKLVTRAEDMIVYQICAEVEGGLKAHFTTFSSPKSDQNDEDDIALSQTLLAPLALLSSHLSFLRSTLPEVTVILLYRRIATGLSEHILQRAILYRGRTLLTPSEGKEILMETELWIETCQGALSWSRNRVEAPWSRLAQHARLVGMEGTLWDELVKATFGIENDQKWKDSIERVVGTIDMSREEVGKVLRLREDCGH